MSEFNDLGKLEMALAQRDRLHDALQQLVDYVKDGCPDDGRYYTMTEAQSALRGIRAVPSDVGPQDLRHD